MIFSISLNWTIAGESAFLIQDMFPITEEYIEREYTIAGIHLMLTSEHTAREIERKARKVMGMLEHMNNKSAIKQRKTTSSLYPPRSSSNRYLPRKC